MKNHHKEKNKVPYSESKKHIPSIELKKIPPEKALHLLRKAGYDINEEQSEEIMEFIYIIVKLTLKEFFTSD
ncbi:MULTISPECIES: hypothetical protein [Chryseobacterium]|uniref:Uncharacterized protein n=1 Tax=Chryseobacterium geocarposphaerae TaxID=1416776 RepID=A0ABU1LBX3_9FLAO|nr:MULTISPECIES: hypothetical protein [Chryseobacterium]MDR6404090.1 hypothetical protein [Chryseobacterium geocarposphaerae]MDR6698391.1 hypothetical protein [Chryseobacterium ginsenosidimutans]